MYKDMASGLYIDNRKKKYMKGQATTKKTALGHCHHNTHRGDLNERLLKEHKCLAKDCPYFEKYEDNPYWKAKEQRKLCSKVYKIIQSNSYRTILVNNEHYFEVRHKSKDGIYRIIRGLNVNSLNDIKFID